MQHKKPTKLLKESGKLPNDLLSELLEIVDTGQYGQQRFAEQLESMRLIHGTILTAKGWRWLHKIAMAQMDLMLVCADHPTTKHMFRKENYMFWAMKWGYYATKAELNGVK